jgi:hypothetical protein
MPFKGRPKDWQGNKRRCPTKGKSKVKILDHETSFQLLDENISLLLVVGLVFYAMDSYIIVKNNLLGLYLK